jgi:hypothetical protein
MKSANRCIIAEKWMKKTPICWRLYNLLDDAMTMYKMIVFYDSYEETLKQLQYTTVSSWEMHCRVNHVKSQSLGYAIYKIFVWCNMTYPKYVNVHCLELFGTVMYVTSNKLIIWGPPHTFKRAQIKGTKTIIWGKPQNKYWQFNPWTPGIYQVAGVWVYSYRTTDPQS